MMHHHLQELALADGSCERVRAPFDGSVEKQNDLKSN
jgi:hypothetical protein